MVCSRWRRAGRARRRRRPRRRCRAPPMRRRDAVGERAAERGQQQERQELRDQAERHRERPPAQLAGSPSPARRTGPTCRAATRRCPAAPARSRDGAGPGSNEGRATGWRPCGGHACRGAHPGASAVPTARATLRFRGTRASIGAGHGPGSTSERNGDGDRRRPALHRLRRAHPRAPDRRCPTTRRRSTATGSGTSRPTRPARSGSTTTATVTPANGMSRGGHRRVRATRTAPRAFRGEMRYTEVRPAAWNAKARLQDMDQDGIDLAVLYPTMLLGLQSEHRRRLRRGAGARVQRLVLRPRRRRARGGCSVRARCRRCTSPTTSQRVAGGDPSRGRAAGHGVGVHAPEPGGRLAAVQRPGLRPASGRRPPDTGLPIALHPFLAPDLPGACVGLRLAPAAQARRQLRRRLRPEPTRPSTPSSRRIPSCARACYFTQAIANPVDVMSCIAYLTAGGVCERFPDAKFIFLEANGGWLVPWLERLDHHCQEVPVGRAGPDDAAVGVLPPAVLDQLRPRRGDARVHRASRRSSAPTASSGRRDYPHPDAKFPGVTEELAEALDGLTLRAEAADHAARARSRSTASAAEGASGETRTPTSLRLGAVSPSAPRSTR